MFAGNKGGDKSCRLLSLDWPWVLGIVFRLPSLLKTIQILDTRDTDLPACDGNRSIKGLDLCRCTKRAPCGHNKSLPRRLELDVPSTSLTSKNDFEHYSGLHPYTLRGS